MTKLVGLAVALSLTLGFAPSCEAAQSLRLVKTSTPHVMMFTDMPSARAIWYANFCEQFLQHVEREFCPLTGKYPMRVCIMSNKDAYEKASQGQYPGAYGCYIPRENTFYSWDGAGLGTMTHEIMHKVCIDAGLIKENWAREGIPTFFEKIYGYRVAGKLVLYMGYQNPWRLRAMGVFITSQKLPDIIARATGDSSDESAQRLVSVFLYQNGCFRKYINLVRAGKKGGFGTYLEAAFGMKMSAIEPLWATYIDGIVSNITLLRLPGSKCFDDKSAFDKFIQANQIPIVTGS
jgi:hypothetical protein